MGFSYMISYYIGNGTLIHSVENTFTTEKYFVKTAYSLCNVAVAFMKYLHSKNCCKFQNPNGKQIDFT